MKNLFIRSCERGDLKTVRVLYSLEIFNILEGLDVAIDNSQNTIVKWFYYQDSHLGDIILGDSHDNKELFEWIILNGDFSQEELINELHFLSELGDTELIRFLIDNTDVNIDTSLFYSSVIDPKVIQFWLDKGLSLPRDLIDDAVDQQAVDTINLLVDSGIQPNTESLKMAMIADDYELTEKILDKGVEPTEEMGEIAVDYNSFKLLQLLINNGLEITDEMEDLAFTEEMRKFLQ